MTAQWIWILCLNCLVKPIKASILIQAREKKIPTQLPIALCPFVTIQKFLLGNGWKGYQSWEKRWFLTEMGLKQDYSTCVWNNKPLSKDDNLCAPLQANEPGFAWSVSSIPQNVQRPLVRQVNILKRAMKSSLGGLHVTYLGAESDKAGEQRTC